MRDTATARRIIGLLVGCGWSLELPEGTKLDGAAHKEAWELVP